MSDAEPPPPPGGPYPPSWPPPGAYPQYQQPQYPQYPPPPLRARSSATGPASFALGLLSAATSWVPVVGVALGVAGLMLGLKAFRLAKLGYRSDRGLAVVGIVLSCLGMALGAVVTGGLLVALAVA